MFEPKGPGGKSYREIAVDVFKNRKPHDVVTYKELADAMGLSVKNDLAQIQQAVNACMKTLLKVYQRGVENVRNIGYRIPPANKHMVVANDHQSRAERQMNRALKWFEGTNEAELTEMERKLHRGHMMLAAATATGFRHLDKRLRRVEELLSGTKTINP